MLLEGVPAMANKTSEPVNPLALRARAVSRLSGRGAAAEQVGAGATEALGVLHQLALSPSTASDALALLHELQVHQIELDLQAEELRASRAELESTLSRQIQLYEASPVGSFTIDHAGTLHELNLTGAALLESDREALLGETLFDHLTPDSGRLLRSMLSCVNEGLPAEPCVLQLLRQAPGPRAVYATARRDPGGQRFLVALMDARADT